MNAKQKTTLENEVDKIIEARLAKIVDERLGDFVTGHLAKKKLTGAAPPDMCKLIDARLKKMVEDQINAQFGRVQDTVNTLYMLHEDGMNRTVAKLVEDHAVQVERYATKLTKHILKDL